MIAKTSTPPKTNMFHLKNGRKQNKSFVLHPKWEKAKIFHQHGGELLGQTDVFYF